MAGLSFGVSNDLIRQHRRPQGKRSRQGKAVQHVAPVAVAGICLKTNRDSHRRNPPELSCLFIVHASYLGENSSPTFGKGQYPPRRRDNRATVDQFFAFAAKR